MSQQLKNLGCGVSIRGAGEDCGSCVGGTESKLETLCNEQLYSLYIYIYIYCGKQVKNNEADRVCGANERKRSSYGNLVRKHKGKRPLGRPTFRRDENNNNK
jgi:hypothetical protein